MDIACGEFMANAWKKDLCVNCQKHESDHMGETTPNILKNVNVSKGTKFGYQQQSQQQRTSTATATATVTATAAATVTETAITTARSRPHQPPPVKPEKPHKSVKSKLPTRTGLAKSAQLNIADSNSTPIFPVPQDSKSNGAKTVPAPPKPQRAVGRSESTRCKPTTATKPVGLQTKASLARAESQRHSRETSASSVVSNRINFYQKPSPLPRQQGAQVTESSESMQSPVISSEVVPEPLHTDKVLPEKETLTGDVADEAEFHEQQTLQNTLKNLNLESNKLHIEDVDGLHQTFLNLQEHEHLHESPFHKLSAKIRHHHNKHLHHPNGHYHHAHPSLHSSHHSELHTTNGHKPTATSPSNANDDEVFYGSVDVTNHSSSSHRPTSVYDNVLACENKGVIQSTVVDTAGYDNARVSLPIQQIMTSPKYDPVPQEMSASHDSNQSERIYAEVTEDILSDLTTKAGQSTMAEYEELSLCGLDVSPKNRTTKSQTLPIAGVQCTAGVDQDIQRSGASKSHYNQCVPIVSTSLAASSAAAGRTNKMSFFRTLLKKGKKSDTIGHSTGPKLDTLDKNNKLLTSYIKDKQMVVDNWVLEQNSTNRLEVGAADRSPSPAATGQEEVFISKAASKRSALSVSVDHSSIGRTGTKGDMKAESVRGGVSPRETLQRPDKKPPPPPASCSGSTKSAPTKSNNGSMFKPTSERRSSLLVVNNNLPAQDLKGNKLILTKDRNGDFIPSPTMPEPANKKRVKIDEMPEGLYDEPWSDVDTVITRSILKMEESVSKSSGKGIGKQIRLPDPLRVNGKKLSNNHARQISMPETSRKVDPVKAVSKSGKTSPMSATDSGYESNSTITTIQRGHSGASDLIHNRLSLPVSGSLRSVVVKATPIDSLPMCLEQISAMNVLTLQKLTKAFLQRDNSVATDFQVTWNDITIEDKTTPIHHNNRCVLYKGHLNQRPAQPITIMLSLKQPETCKTYSPNLLQVTNQFRAEVESEFIPQQIVKAFKVNTSPANGDADGIPDKVTVDETVSECSRTLEVYVTLLPSHNDMESVISFIKSRDTNSKSDEHLVMDSLFILLQVISIIFSLSERQLQIESLSAGDLIVSLDADSIPTVYCHMISIKESSADFTLTCEKLRMFLIQLTHASERLTKSKDFNTVEDLIQSSSDAGDLRTIALIIQYLLWGPKEDEVKVMSVAENRKQAFELWLHLSRGKLLNELVFQSMDRLKIYTIANFLSNTSGQELFKITKLLSTY